MTAFLITYLCVYGLATFAKLVQFSRRPDNFAWIDVTIHFFLLTWAAVLLSHQS